MRGTSLKNEGTWWRVLSHYDAENYTAQKIGFLTFTLGSGTDGTLYVNGPPTVTARSRTSIGTTAA